MVKQDSASVTVHVQPNARQNSIFRFADGVLYLKIAAPPERGKANEAVLELLSDFFGVSKGEVDIRYGMTGRRKMVAIKGLNQSQIAARLA